MPTSPLSEQSNRADVGIGPYTHRARRGDSRIARRPTKEDKMGNEKPKLECYQKILFVIAILFLSIALIAVFLHLCGVDLSAMWFGIPICIACECFACMLWKKNPMLYTAHIALWSFCLGVCFLHLIRG